VENLDDMQSLHMLFVPEGCFLAFKWHVSSTISCLQAKHALSPLPSLPATNDAVVSEGLLLPDGDGSSNSSSNSSSQLTLWPILAALGTDNVATSVVAGIL